MKHFALLFTLVFGLTGLGLLVGAFFSANNTIEFRSNSLTAEGVVVDFVSSRDSDGDTLYKPVIEWTDSDGTRRSFTSSMASSPPSHARGDQVNVRYRPEDPDLARLDSFMENWMVPLLLGVMGGVFTSVGFGIGAHAWRKRRERAWLEARGTRIQATLTSVDHDTSMKVNGRSPWRISAQWRNPDTGVVHTFRSEAIWFDPSEYIERETLDVLIDPSKPSIHLIDLGFLPKHAS